MKSNNFSSFRRGNKYGKNCKSKDASTIKKEEEPDDSPPDLAMYAMIVGACCKILELLFFRHVIMRYYISIAGAILITVGSAILCYSSVMTMRGVWPPPFASQPQNDVTTPNGISAVTNTQSKKKNAPN